MSVTNTPAIVTESPPVASIPDAIGRELHPLEHVILPVASVPDATGGGGAVASEPAEPLAEPHADPEQTT